MPFSDYHRSHRVNLRERHPSVFHLKTVILMGEQRPLYQEDDWVKMSLAIPFQYKPGTHFVYNNVGPYLAGILVQRRSGCDLVSYHTPRLFKHLGISGRHGRRILLETVLEQVDCS